MTELTLEEATHRLSPVYTPVESAVWWDSTQLIFEERP